MRRGALECADRAACIALDTHVRWRTSPWIRIRLFVRLPHREPGHLTARTPTSPTRSTTTCGCTGVPVHPGGAVPGRFPRVREREPSSSGRRGEGSGQTDTGTVCITATSWRHGHHRALARCGPRASAPGVRRYPAWPPSGSRTPSSRWCPSSARTGTTRR